jgi:hypothetical protein
MVERIARAIDPRAFVDGLWATPGSYPQQYKKFEAEAAANRTLQASHHAELVEALKEARAALHQHYVDWDGEPEDVVPLQEARSRCDAVLAKIGGAS